MNERTKERTHEATAFAPACVGNLAVGFDLLGHPIDGLGDRVTARRVDRPGVRITDIRGVTTDLPKDTNDNTASRTAAALLAGLGVRMGVELSIEKGIRLASGLGGSAASAVAAVVATNALLDQPLEHRRLYPFALEGERVASGADCGDNVGPQLLGGLILAVEDDLLRIPVPDGLTAAVVTPAIDINTRATREALRPPFRLEDVTLAQGNLARVLMGCCTNDFEMIGKGLRDVLIEPRRASLIPSFHRVQQAALDCGALGCSISGSGPSLFAWFASEKLARMASTAMVDVFEGERLETVARVSRVDSPGARLLV